MRFTSIFQQNETNTRLHNHNSAVFCSFRTDYNYLCFIRATAKCHKEEAWYEVIYAKAEYQEFELSEDIRLNVKVLFTACIFPSHGKDKHSLSLLIWLIGKIRTY